MNINVASNWNELNSWQLSKIARLFFSFADEQKVKHRLVYILFLKKPTIWNYYKFWKLVKRVPFPELYRFTDFLNRTNTYTKFPKKLKLGFVTLYGPGDRLKSTTIDQFSHADLFFYRWSKTHDVKELNRFVSILYLPKGKKFSNNDLGHSRYVKLMPLGVKLSIALSYIGTRQVMGSNYKHVFPKSNKQGSGKYYSFDKIVIAMARGESKPFGGVYQTKDAKLYDFMHVYDEELKDQKQQKSA